MKRSFEMFYDHRWKYLSGIIDIEITTESTKNFLGIYKGHHCISILGLKNYFNFISYARHNYIDNIPCYVYGTQIILVFKKKNKWVVPYFYCLLLGADIDQINARICLDRKKFKK